MLKSTSAEGMHGKQQEKDHLVLEMNIMEQQKKELTQKVELLQESLDHIKQDNKDLRDDNKEKDVERFQQEKQIQELTHKVQLIDELRKQIDSGNEQKQHLDETLKVYKANTAKMESKLDQSVKEINKGNEIIK